MTCPVSSAKFSAPGQGGGGIFLQSRVYRINLHGVNAERNSALRVQDALGGVARRLCAAISYSRLFAVNLHTTKESKVPARGLGVHRYEPRREPDYCALSFGTCLHSRTHRADNSLLSNKLVETEYFGLLGFFPFFRPSIFIFFTLLPNDFIRDKLWPQSETQAARITFDPREFTRVRLTERRKFKSSRTDGNSSRSDFCTIRVTREHFAFSLFFFYRACRYLI